MAAPDWGDTDVAVVDSGAVDSAGVDSVVGEAFEVTLSLNTTDRSAVDVAGAAG